MNQCLRGHFWTSSRLLCDFLKLLLLGRRLRLLLLPRSDQVFIHQRGLVYLILDYCSFCFSFGENSIIWILEFELFFVYCLLLVSRWFLSIVTMVLWVFVVVCRRALWESCVALVGNVSFVVNCLTSRFQDHPGNKKLNFKPVWGAGSLLKIFSG